MGVTATGIETCHVSAGVRTGGVLIDMSTVTPCSSARGRLVPDGAPGCRNGFHLVPTPKGAAEGWMSCPHGWEQKARGPCWRPFMLVRDTGEVHTSWH